MPNIKTLDIQTISCNTIDTKEVGGAGNQKTEPTASSQQGRNNT